MSEEVWRTYQIDCPEGRSPRGQTCPKCGLPRDHHEIRFEVVEYHKAKDVWRLRVVQEAGFNPNASTNTRSTIITYSAKEFGKFRVHA